MGVWGGRLLTGHWTTTVQPTSTVYHGNSRADLDSTSHRLCLWGDYFHNGALRIAVDGRLDNEAELRTLLNTPRNKGENLPQLIGMLYQQMGIRVLAHLVGDLAVAIINLATNSVVLYRDVIGVRPLYWSRCPDRLLWSSDLRHLLDLFEHFPELDEHYVAAYLTGGDLSARSPYKNIESCPPGYVVELTSSGIRKHRVADLFEGCSRRYGGDVIEGFRHYFIEAVRNRLTGTDSCVAELSGGIDSSSIVSVAQQLIRGGSVRCRRLDPVTFVYDGSRSSDEKFFVQLVESDTGVRTTFLGGKTFCDTFGPVAFTAVPSPLSMFSEMWQSVKIFVEKAGAKVLLSGIGGDNLLATEEAFCPVLADHLCRGHLFNLLASLRAIAERTGNTYLHCLFMGAAWPLMPWFIKRRWIPVELAVPDWLSRTLIDRYEMRKVTCMLSLACETFSRSQEWRCLQIAAARNGVAAGFYESFGLAAVTFPYLSKPLIDFMLSIPDEWLGGKTAPRTLQRLAMKGIVADPVIARRGKRGPDEPILRGILRIKSDFIANQDEYEIVQRGYIDVPRFRQAITRAAAGVFEMQTFHLVRIFSLEYFLRGLRSFAPTRYEAQVPCTGN